ncbi:MAG: P pilus assembly/Cpx signaling pathway, periplasmic inhibitor/zinc-resistance associated protein [Brasilonema octagenarum HA4186-MV1]|jgi:Spy/CpxP family protein refolding chaperone|nr:P pilus assembly/Cpx signaling pathway, periplasmic inhibitor/zinc-resistance associated protein [Brasilonema octagenarum HA4186-MV1]
MKMKALLLPAAIMVMFATSPVIFTHAAVAAPGSRAEAWQAKLNLTDAQKAKMKEIRESSKKQIDALLTPEQRTQKEQARQQRKKPNLNLTADQKAKMKEIRQNTKTQMQALLTPEQQQQWKQMREQKRQSQ